MDCSICSPELSPIRTPLRYSMCQACYLGAKGMIDFLKKLEHNREIIDKPSCSYLPKSNSSKFQGISDALKWVKDMNEKLSFLSGSVTAFKDGIRADIQVKPGNGSSIFAHRVVLAARSGIFKNMLETDGCKAPPNETISLPELNHEELESLLEFLYSGSLPIDKLDKNKYSLLEAAHKYEIPYLQKICENRILESIDSSKLTEAAIDFITKHIKNMEVTTPLPKKKKHHNSGRSKNSDSKGKSRAEANATTEDTQSECHNRGMSNSGSRSGRSRSNNGSRSGRSRSNSGSRSRRSRSGRSKSNSGRSRSRSNSGSRSRRSRSNSGSRSRSGSRSKSGGRSKRRIRSRK